MTGKKLTFSRQAKDELCGIHCSSPCCQQAELAAAFFGAGRIADRTFTLYTTHLGSAQRLAGLIRQRYHQDPSWQSGREIISLTIAQPAVFLAICADLQQLFGFNPDTGTNGSLNCPAKCCQQALLRALFLACGSISEPTTAYHLELSIRRPDMARMAADLLGILSIRTGILHRHGHDVVYISEGQHIADFLLYTGAHYSLMTFESLRVEKEMRNSVNRVVNCDSANSQRIANTAARQLDLLRQINELPDMTILPADLQLAAEVRLANPDFSLKELGELMQPPLGKSGMNHRLRRLEQVAADLLAEKGKRGNGT
jgi:DNA-binding transcriptional regulator WhiA